MSGAHRFIFRIWRAELVVYDVYVGKQSLWGLKVWSRILQYQHIVSGFSSIPLYLAVGYVPARCCLLGRGHTSLAIVLGSAQNTAKVSIVTFCYENICTKMLVYYIVHWRKFYVFTCKGRDTYNILYKIFNFPDTTLIRDFRVHSNIARV